MRPKRDKPISEAQPFASPHHNVDSSYADGEGNGHKTTDDTQPAYKPHEIHYENVPCHPGKDVAKLPNDVAKLPDDKALVVQDLLPPEPIQLTTSKEFKSVEDTSNLAERNGQATPPPAVNKFVRPRDGVVHQSKRYILNSMNEHLLQLPRATAYFTLNDRGGVEIFTLHCSRYFVVLFPYKHVYSSVVKKSHQIWMQRKGLLLKLENTFTAMQTDQDILFIV